MARQWESATLKPRSCHFCRLEFVWWAWAVSHTETGPGSAAPCLMRLTECSPASIPERGAFLVVLMFSKQTMCPYLWEILDTVAVTTERLSATLPLVAWPSCVGLQQKSARVPKPGGFKVTQMARVELSCRALGWTPPSVQTIRHHTHAH